ncbi:c-type cytochrome [Pleomorphomonas carboxyditropha]|uniref:Cytochrome c family protein n=1 Tax=Pleomorphomonas carboxyditropha TaxID=2023338 RepID=A0A2G9X0Z8_9HYPH|nr:cytochrome c family protein [Pleomorphomonas carboxyditropha]PIP00605.1 cytochrome c family protein [Pleomorphomonas carboxyditropha]
MKYTVPALILSVLIPAPALADGDPAKGKRVFNKCAICHAVGPDANAKVGVELNGVVGRPIASVEGFDYSPALQAFGAGGKVWDEATLSAYLADPMKFIDKGKMAFVGIKKQNEIDHLIAYLKTFDLDGSLRQSGPAPQIAD